MFFPASAAASPRFSPPPPPTLDPFQASAARRGRADVARAARPAGLGRPDARGKSFFATIPRPLSNSRVRRSPAGPRRRSPPDRLGKRRQNGAREKKKICEALLRANTSPLPAGVRLRPSAHPSPSSPARLAHPPRGSRSASPSLLLAATARARPRMWRWPRAAGGRRGEQGGREAVAIFRRDENARTRASGRRQTPRAARGPGPGRGRGGAGRGGA